MLALQVAPTVQLMTIEASSFKDFAAEFWISYRLSARIQEVWAIVEPVANEEGEKVKRKVG